MTHNYSQLPKPGQTDKVQCSIRLAIMAASYLYREPCLIGHNLEMQQVVSQVSSWLFSRLVCSGSMCCQGIGPHLLQSGLAVWLLSVVHHRSAEAVTASWRGLYRSHASCSIHYCVKAASLVMLRWCCVLQKMASCTQRWTATVNHTMLATSLAHGMVNM